MRSLPAMFPDRFKMDSEWDSCFQMFEEKISAKAEWLDEILWKKEVQGSKPDAD